MMVIGVTGLNGREFFGGNIGKHGENLSEMRGAVQNEAGRAGHLNMPRDELVPEAAVSIGSSNTVAYRRNMPRGMFEVADSGISLPSLE